MVYLNPKRGAKLEKQTQKDFEELERLQSVCECGHRLVDHRKDGDCMIVYPLAKPFKYCKCKEFVQKLDDLHTTYNYKGRVIAK